MQLIGNLKDGFALVTKRGAVLSLGWRVWGIDISFNRHIMFHVWPIRAFIKWESDK